MPTYQAVDYDPWATGIGAAPADPQVYNDLFRKFSSAAAQTWPGRLAQSAWSAATLPGDVWQGKVDPNSEEGLNRMHELASMVVGGGLPAAERGAVGTAGGRLAKDVAGIRAYHGSPYDFDRFDISKIGTGEGAQTYGRGLYFAEAEPVARTYRDIAEATVNGRPFNAEEPVHRAAQLVEDKGSREAAIQEAAARGRHDPGDYWDRVARYLQSDRPLPEIKSSGRMYEVNINADPEQFLDWDKPLGQQPAAAQDVFRSRLINYDVKKDTPAENVLGTMDWSGPMRDAGIPGIKYLDQGSRSAGKGTRNYVVFDPNLIDIVRKYGIAGLSVFGVGEGANVFIPVDHDPFAVQ